MPSGSVTVVSRRCAVASPSGSSSPSCGKPRFTVSPVGESGSEESGCALNDGSNGSRSQPVGPCGGPQVEGSHVDWSFQV